MIRSMLTSDVKGAEKLSTSKDKLNVCKVNKASVNMRLVQEGAHLN